AVFHALVPVVDPMRKIRSVNLYVAPGEGKPGSTERAADGTWKLLEGAARVEMKMELPGLAAAAVQLPARGKSLAPVPLACAYDGGDVVASRPVPFRLDVDVVQTGDDAMPMTALNRFPERYEGKVVVVRGNLYPAVVKRGDILELQVQNEKSVKPMNLYFV